MRYLLAWVWLVCLAGRGLAARILVVLPFPGTSHHLFATAIMKALAQRGHQVVEYSPYPPHTPYPNHTHVEVHTTFEKQLGSWTYQDFKDHPTKYDKSIYGLKFRRIWEMNYGVCEDTFKHENIQKLLKSNDHFDLVMTESTFGEESLLIFGHRFSAPTITIECFFPWSVLNRDTGNTLSIASVADLTSHVFTNEFMSFTERVLNSISVLLTLLTYHLTHIPLHDNIIKQNYHYVDTPPLAQMVANVSLYLTNSHPAAVNYIRPYTPNIVPIGGINIVPQKAPLSQDIQSFLDNARDGVIYFSLGTVVPTHIMPKEILQIFLNVFKRLPQKVLWKIQLQSLPGLPENVKIIKWAPQLGVLSHPNCRLFITHGGLFSHQETIHAGVPTVGIPFFADQPYNVMFTVHRGTGIGVDFDTLSEEALYTAITTVLNNPKYKENANRLSRIYRDRPLSPADTAVFWVEYVLRHRGAHHLRPASAALNWYQLTLLDVLAAILAVLILSVIIISTIIRKVLSLVCSRGKHRKLSRDKKEN